MPFRIEVTTKTDQRDVASESLLTRLKGFFDFSISSINIVTVYVIDLPISQDEAKTALEEIFYDPVIHYASLDSIDVLLNEQRTIVSGRHLAVLRDGSDKLPRLIVHQVVDFYLRHNTPLK
ncbi:hypothetical protein IID62_09805 [candidate division KSB1 bacterium]|nr:hypothetical protein [candidate division KSB1 bacterium]